MLVDHWPLAGLRLRTPGLELRWPTNEELARLADVAADGVHDPSLMPFYVPWTDAEPAVRARSVILNFWRRTGEWTPESWGLPLVVFRDGEPVGMQRMRADNFAITREVHTGSWLGRRYHGQGIGTQMRAAVLEFAFSELGAETACSGAFADNPASLAVSRKLGYRDDGISRHVVQGRVRVEQRLRLDRADWQAPFRVPVEGLEGCLPLFGL